MDTRERAGTALQARGQDLQAALRDAISLWASATTADGARRADLLRDKRSVVLSFFDASKKLPSEVEPSDGQEWLRGLSEKGRSPNTVYQHACLLSSFYYWTMRDPEFGQYVRGNP